MNTFRHNDVSSISRCRKLAEEVLGKDWESKGADVYKDGQIPGREDTVIWALGHCAWSCSDPEES